MSVGRARLATPDDWCDLLREFGEDQKPYLQVWLDATADAINVSCWKKKSCTAHIFMAAHLLDVAAGNERGPVNQKRIDKLSVMYSAVGLATGLDAQFSSTKYGRAFLTLRSTLIVLPTVGRRTLNRPPSC